MYGPSWRPLFRHPRPLHFLFTPPHASPRSPSSPSSLPPSPPPSLPLASRRLFMQDMKSLGITESFKSKLQVLISAAEAAEMIIRVDDIIKSAPRERG